MLLIAGVIIMATKSLNHPSYFHHFEFVKENLLFSN